MNNREWRSYGHSSRLSLLVCDGGSDAATNQAEQTQTQVSQAQLNLANQENTQSQQQYQQQQALEAPAIAQQTALAAGNPAAVLAATAPTISTLSQQFPASQEQIQNSLPPGPARDAALAQLTNTKNSTIAGTEANLVQQAPGTLANIGAGLGAESLQQIGAALSGFSGANTTAQGIETNANAEKANTIGLISGLTGGLGTAAGGLLGNKNLFAPSGSDLRLKTNIEALNPMLDQILGLISQIRLVRFEYRDNPGFERIGVIAQEVMDLLPEVTDTREDGMLTVDYGQLAAVALAGIQELSKQVAELREQINGIVQEKIDPSTHPPGRPDTIPEYQWNVMSPAMKRRLSMARGQ